MRSRKPFRMKGLFLLSLSSLPNCRGITICLLIGAIALVHTPVAGINVPYDNNRSSPDPTDPDFSYSYVLNKDVRYRKPKYFNVNSSNQSSASNVNKNITDNASTSVRGIKDSGKGSTTALVSASSPVSVSSSYSTSSSTPKLTMVSGSRNER